MNDLEVLSELRRELFYTSKNSLYILSGPAGTGKTTFIRDLIKCNTQKKSINIICPTNKSICNLVENDEALQKITKTYASFFRCSFDLLDEDNILKCSLECCTNSEHQRDLNSILSCLRSNNNKLSYNLDLLIVEEASMFNHQFYNLLEYCPGIKKILFVGDSNQIPPITNECIDCLNCTFSVFSTSIPQYILREQKRHCTELDIQLQTFLRHIESLPTVTKSKIESSLTNIFSVKVLSDALPITSPILTYHVNTAKQINHLLTNSRKEIKVGDVVTIDKGSIDAIPVGSIALVTDIRNEFYNCIKLERGFNFVVYELLYKNKKYELNLIDPSGLDEYISHCRKLRQNKSLHCIYSINQLVKEHLTEINFGYSITAHKSQGLTYNTSYIAYEDILSCKNKKMVIQLLYTTITRARNNIILVKIPDYYKVPDKSIIDDNFYS